jgi:hypothetical protein
LLGELHLTHGAALLDIDLPPADCSRFEALQTPSPAGELTPTL